MTTETKRLEVDKDTKVERLAEAARSNPVVFEIDGLAYAVNLVGRGDSPFTAESAYASVKTIDGRSGADVSNEEIVDAIEQAKEEHAGKILDEMNQR